MSRLRSLLVSTAAAALVGTIAPATAGGFMTPEGQGEIIVGLSETAASRSFNQVGKVVTSPPYRKAAVSAYAEYGLRSWLTIIAAPSAARMQAGSAGNAFSGSDESAFGARLKLWGAETRTVALQALVEPPLGGRANPATELALGGPHAAAVDLRFQFAQAIDLWGRPAFLTIEPGARLRSGGWPNEARFDIAFGVRPTSRDLVLLKGFASSAPSAGPPIPRTAYAKLQLSYVYDLSAAWAIEFGGWRTVMGRNTARETGPFTSLWFRF